MTQSRHQPDHVCLSAYADQAEVEAIVAELIAAASMLDRRLAQFAREHPELLRQKGELLKDYGLRLDALPREQRALWHDGHNLPSVMRWHIDTITAAFTRDVVPMFDVRVTFELLDQHIGNPLPYLHALYVRILTDEQRGRHETLGDSRPRRGQ